MQHFDLPDDLQRDYASACLSARVLARPDSAASLSSILDTWSDVTRTLERIAERIGLSRAWINLHPITRLVASELRKRAVVAPETDAERSEVVDLLLDIERDAGRWGGYVNDGATEPDAAPSESVNQPF